MPQPPALADTLKDSGWFSHGLEGDHPSDAGHGNYRINKLLAGTAMVGDSEQYASAMALMARDLGLPSRVVLGFLPKNEDGEITDARTEKTSGNGTKIEFTGNDVTAWVEIKLQGLGWVAFYPTPKETKMPDENQNLTPPNPQTLVRQPPVPLTDPLRDQTQAKGQSSLAGADADDSPTNLFWARFWASDPQGGPVRQPIVDPTHRLRSDSDVQRPYCWHERGGMAVRKPVWQQVGMPYACLPSKAASQPRALVEIRPVPSPVNSAQMTRL